MAKSMRMPLRDLPGGVKLLCILADDSKIALTDIFSVYLHKEMKVSEMGYRIWCIGSGYKKIELFDEG